MSIHHSTVINLWRKPRRLACGSSQRQKRFNNRKASKQKGWLAPSICNKIDTHLTTIDKITKILPISEIHVEVASFDIQKIKNPNYEVYGFKLFDKVLFQNMECFIFGRRSSGQMDIRKLDGTHVNTSANYKKLKLLENSKHILTERSTGSFLPAISNVVSTS